MRTRRRAGPVMSNSGQQGYFTGPQDSQDAAVSGSYLDPQDIKQRQMIAEKLLQDSMTPKAPEQSWTQGASRMAEALVGIKKKHEAASDAALMAQQEASDTQSLAAALRGETDLGTAISQVRSPQIQAQILGLMQQEREHKMAREERDQDYTRSRSDKKEDMSYENQMRSQSEQDIRNLDPIKKLQDEIYTYQKVINHPEASEQMKEEAKKRISQVQGSISAMSPSKTTINVDTGDKAAMAGDKVYSEEGAKEAIKKERSIIDGAADAPDKISSINQIEDDIKSGKLGKVDVTKFGNVVQTFLSRIGAPNDARAVGDYLKEVNNQALDARQRMKGQGTISNMEAQVAAKTVFLEGEPLEATLSKSQYFKQLHEREVMAGKIAEEWKKRYGGTHKPNENGQTFDEAQRRLIEATPIKSWEQIYQERIDAASKKAAEGSSNPTSASTSSIGSNMEKP